MSQTPPLLNTKTSTHATNILSLPPPYMPRSILEAEARAAAKIVGEEAMAREIARLNAASAIMEQETAIILQNTNAIEALRLSGCAGAEAEIARLDAEIMGLFTYQQMQLLREIRLLEGVIDRAMEIQKMRSGGEEREVMLVVT